MAVHRPFWQILIEMHNPVKTIELNCDECFLYLEYMIDWVTPGEEIETLIEAIQHHIERCPGCREHHMMRIQELEAQWSQLSQRQILAKQQSNENFRKV